MESSQPIRPSQFITTYGPGAVLEGLNGPRLIMSIENSGLFHSESPEKFEIVEPGLSQILPDQGRIFHIPSNAEFALDDSKAAYETTPFPKWSLCVKHSLLYKAKVKSVKSCPECPPETSSYNAWKRARQEAVSFVFVCPDGHLDDVPWDYLIHDRSSSCKTDTVIWKGAGGPLRGVKLECPRCRQSASLADLYHREHHCLGLYRENGNASGPGSCVRKARISQRAASDLFLPEIVSALTVPRQEGELHEALRHQRIEGFLDGFTPDEAPSQTQWDKILAKVPEKVRDIIGLTSLESRWKAVLELWNQSEIVTAETARQHEFNALRKAARDGYLDSPSFMVEPGLTRSFPLGPYTINVTPISRLRVTLAQIGYRRLGGTVVDTRYRRGSNNWFAGVELFGEGLFLELGGPLSLASKSCRDWQTRHDQNGIDRDHPVSVWWHTLSHRLVRALAINSGYSAASVRERLYRDGEHGGLLLYAVQPGGDGTLGGLIALVPKFDSILTAALRNLDSCSNDPLCGDHEIRENRASGAACYACSLLSETACELRNHALDRRVLLETL